MFGLGLGLGLHQNRFGGVGYSNLWYGVKINTAASTYDAERIGSPTLHKMLPWHNKWRRCILKDDGTVNYYLHQNNSLLKEDGTPAVLDGTDGQWMVEVPEHYEMFWQEGDYLCAAISEYAVPSFTRIPKLYISAGEATVHRPTNKLSCVISNSVEYRGGNNATAEDATDKTLLGKPATVISRTNFRAYARNRGSVNWNCYTYDAHRILFWAYITEYANTHCQLPFNSQLTSDGYKQGGLGKGVTDLNGTFWGNWNGYYPFINIGITSSLGNNTGVVQYQMPASYQVVAGNPSTPISVEVPSYRGVENPFGHIWKNADGINVLIQSVADGGLTKVYVSNNPNNFQDADGANYELVGNASRTEGYVKSLIVDNKGTFMPATVGASATTYYCDYFYTNIPASGTSTRTCLLGGYASNGATAGLGYAATYGAPSYTYTYIGSRLCYITEFR